MHDCKDRKRDGCFFLDRIAEKLTTSASGDNMEIDGDGASATNVPPDHPEHLIMMIKDCKFSMKLKMADSAWMQNNFSVATKLLKELHREAKLQSSWLLTWVHSFTRYSHRRCQSQDNKEQILSVLKTVPLLDETQMTYTDATAKFFQDHHILLGTTYSILASTLSKDSTLLQTVGNEKAERLLQLSGTSSPSDPQQKFGKDIEKLLGPGGSKLFEKRKDKAILKSVEALEMSMRRFQKEPGNLKEYSPWMSSFRADILKNELEIPGQYDGRSKPLPEYHAKIVGFDERVKVMTSIRKPKRLIIRGDDEQEHPFLVKGGEDLRQDQRIEQLFGIMNTVLSQDSSCSQRNMHLHTYQVVPMTSRIGLIEWIGNTCTLKEFLCSSMTEEEKKNILRPNEAYDTWLSRKAGKAEGIARYAEAYKKVNRNDMVTNFRNIERLVPEDLLRRAFLKMSRTPEAFLFLRSHFSSSHALICISQWVLGIGDRHLNNFMVNMETGGAVGIDFGHAFGSATQFLPVPELMPFRLTRQFLNLMQPMRESGLIQSVMVHSLRAFRADPDLLLNTMDIFVKEPSLDWKNFELKQLKKGGTWVQTVNTKEINWYPVQKVNFARRKLEGANPAVITSEELKLGFEKEAAFRGMLAVVLGHEEHNVRARENADGLSVEAQVDCLLDQATDPNVLGRVWIGWEPWM